MRYIAPNLREMGEISRGARDQPRVLCQVVTRTVVKMRLSPLPYPDAWSTGGRGALSSSRLPIAPLPLSRTPSYSIVSSPAAVVSFRGGPGVDGERVDQASECNCARAGVGSAAGLERISGPWFISLCIIAAAERCCI